MSTSGTSIKRHLAALRAMAVFTLVLGVGYPLTVTAIAQAVMPAKANGSLVTDTNGRTVASTMLCQQWVDKDGNALPEYFQARPSAASGSSTDPGCNYTLSGGTNRGTDDPQLKATIRNRIDAYAKAYDIDPATVPQDAVTASASGLDPAISVANAEIQAPHVARARNLDPAVVEALIEKNTSDRTLGFLGQRSVNTTTLNLALDSM